MGLLDRVRILDSNSSGPKVRETIISSFEHSPGNIDFPGAVFYTFKSLLNFRKAALLLPDPREDDYYPWISIGFDRTTTRRLRIPVDFPALKNSQKTLFPISSKDLSGLLSNRELGLTDDLWMIKLGPEKKPSALLIASELNPSTIGSGVESDIKQLSRELGDGIAQSRLMMEGYSDDEISDLTEWLGSWDDKPAVLVTLDITAAIDSLVESIQGLELYRARKDVVNLIRHLTGRMGRLHDLKDGRVLILFPRERLPDYELYLHHLSRSFSALFFKLQKLPDFPAVFNLWPEDRQNVEDNLSGFF